jgi:hypothetical protein
MAVLGILACKTCMEYTCLGKWLRREDAFGFWRGGTSYEELGLKTLNFLAKHTNHDVVMQTTGIFDEWADNFNIPDELRPVEEELSITWPQDEVQR